MNPYYANPRKVKGSQELIGESIMGGAKQRASQRGGSLTVNNISPDAADYITKKAEVRESLERERQKLAREAREAWENRKKNEAPIY
jgi:hypothetical protein